MRVVSLLLMHTVFSLLMYCFPGEKELLDLTGAFLIFEIIWILVELFEVIPSLPCLGLFLPSRTPLPWRKTGFI